MSKATIPLEQKFRIIIVIIEYASNKYHGNNDAKGMIYAFTSFNNFNRYFAAFRRSFECAQQW